MIEIATPISHLFEDENVAKKIAAASDCLECRDKSLYNTMEKQFLFHCEVQINHPLNEESVDYLKTIKKLKPDLKLISFHMASACTEPVLETKPFNIFKPGGRMLQRKEMIENTRANCKKIRSVMGTDVKIAVENNNYYPTDAYKHITEPDFISEVVNTNEILFLFDLAHAKLSAHNQKARQEEYIRALPMDKCIQIHSCIPEIPGPDDIAIDRHGLPGIQDFFEVKDILGNYPTIHYITIEYYQDPEKLVHSLQQLRSIIHE
jgi:sugar phosphate isomerase/epimerase